MSSFKTQSSPSIQKWTDLIGNRYNRYKSNRLLTEVVALKKNRLHKEEEDKANLPQREADFFLYSKGYHILAFQDNLKFPRNFKYQHPNYIPQIPRTNIEIANNVYSGQGSVSVFFNYDHETYCLKVNGLWNTEQITRIFLKSLD